MGGTESMHARQGSQVPQGSRGRRHELHVRGNGSRRSASGARSRGRRRWHAIASKCTLSKR